MALIQKYRFMCSFTVDGVEQVIEVVSREDFLCYSEAYEVGRALGTTDFHIDENPVRFFEFEPDAECVHEVRKDPINEHFCRDMYDGL